MFESSNVKKYLRYHLPFEKIRIYIFSHTETQERAHSTHLYMVQLIYILNSKHPVFAAQLTSRVSRATPASPGNTSLQVLLQEYLPE